MQEIPLVSENRHLQKYDMHESKLEDNRNQLIFETIQLGIVLIITDCRCT